MNVDDNIMQYFRETATGNAKKEYHLWLVPSITLLCMQRLKQHGVDKVFECVKEFPLHIFKMESDLFSLELPLCYKVMFQLFMF